MSKAQDRHERVGLRAATFLKRCGRNPETGQLLSLTGKLIDDDVNPVHSAALALFKKRQRKVHQWTPKLPAAIDLNNKSNLSAKILQLLADPRALINRTACTTAASNDDNNDDENHSPDRSHEQQQTNRQRDHSPASLQSDEPAGWHALLQDDDAEVVLNEFKKGLAKSTAETSQWYVPPQPSPPQKQQHQHKSPASVTAVPWTSASSPSPGSSLRRQYPNLQCQQSPSLSHPCSGTNSSRDYTEAIDQSNQYLSLDATRHVSHRHLKEDNKLHKVLTSQIIRGDGCDKVTSGIPPDQRFAARPGRVDIFVEDEAVSASPKRLVSRLVSQKQLAKEKMSHSADFVTRF